MIVRQLVAQFGVSFDKASAVKSKQQMETVFDSMKRIGAAVFVGMAALGAKHLTNLASTVEETANILNAAFGESKKEVSNWAKTFADAAGRSGYALEYQASRFGALLTPALEGNEKLSAELSKGLTEAMVDLASFYELTEKEVGINLKSGLAGELEPLRKFGILMTQAALEEYAQEKGMKKKYRTLKESEKIQLRANFIMEKAAIAQGDAIRTAGSYANQTKRLEGNLHELGVEVGFKLIPFMKFLTSNTSSIIGFFKDLAKDTKALEAVMVIAGVAIGIFGAKFLKWLAPMGKWAPLLTALFLIVEDFLVLLDGGESVIGKLIDKIWGPGSAEEAVRALKGTFAEIGPVIKEAFSSSKDTIGEFVDWLQGDATPKIVDNAIAMRYAFEQTFKNIGFQVERFSLSLQIAFKGIEASWEAVKMNIGRGSHERLNKLAKEAQGLGARMINLQKESGLYNTMAGMVQYRMRGAHAVASNVINENIIVNMSGNMADPNLAQSVADRTGREVWNQNRATINALKQGAE